MCIRRANKAVGRVTDEVGAACLCQRFAHEVGILWAVVLQERALQLLFVVVGSNVNVLHCQGVNARIIHHRRCRAGGGVVVLHLLGRVAVFLQANGKLNGIIQRRARVAGHQIGYKILLFSNFVCNIKELLAEFFIDLKIGFSHASKHRRGAMLGRDLELTADVISHELAEERIVFVLE